MYSRLVTTSPKNHLTYERISARLKNCGIKLEHHIEGNLEVYESVLDGINFKLTNFAPSLNFEKILTLAKKNRNQAFRFKKLNDEHWPFLLSLGATNGIGFREIQYPFLLNEGDISIKSIKSGKSLNIDKLDSSLFGAQFGDTVITMDSPSLHCAIDYSGEYCSIHIDETGFTIGGIYEDVIINPEFIRHLLVELIWKDKLKVPKGIELVTPSASNYYDRFGLRADFSVLNNKSISVEQSCSIHSGLGCAATISLSGMF